MGLIVDPGGNPFNPPPQVMRLPIAICCPRKPSREWFFKQYVMPAALANLPYEFLVDATEGKNEQDKRNEMAEKSKSAFLFFLDDDTILGLGILAAMLKKLFEAPADVGYCYCDSYGIVLPGVNHQTAGTFVTGHDDWNEEELKRHSGVHPMTLWKRQALPKWDPEIHKAAMWDLQLSAWTAGWKGIHLAEVGFLQYWIDDGITNSKQLDVYREIRLVRKKHGLE